MTDAERFWAAWSPWRHGAPGGANFADVMRVLRLYERFADFVAGQLPPGARGVTVVDLACGGAQLAAPLSAALLARGATLDRYVGVDFADPAGLSSRVSAELARAGLERRGTYVHHDLSTGLPADLGARVHGDGPLLVTSCWGITYLGPAALRTLVDGCVALGAHRGGSASLSVNMLTAGQFDREVLTQRFLREVAPRQIRDALRQRRVEPARELVLAMRALPKMRAFGDELKRVVTLMSVDGYVEVLGACGLAPRAVDRSALWGQTTSVSVTLKG